MTYHLLLHLIRVCVDRTPSTHDQLSSRKNDISHLTINLALKTMNNIHLFTDLLLFLFVSVTTEPDFKSKDWVFLNYTYKRFEGLTQRGSIPPTQSWTKHKTES